MNYISTFFNSLVHLLYPGLCAGCGNDLPAKQPVICLSCQENLPLTHFHYFENNPVEKVFYGRLPVSSATALLYFGKQSPVQNLLHHLKYHANKEIGVYFGRKIGAALRESPRYNDVDLLVPLPLSRAKEKRRGYNQSALLCAGIAEVMKLPVADKTVIRKKDTPSQTGKNRADRWENISGGFELGNSSALRGKHVLLVDDVLTTGATMEACGSVLLQAGIVKLSLAALAYTML